MTFQPLDGKKKEPPLPLPTFKKRYHKGYVAPLPQVATTVIRNGVVIRGEGKKEES